MPKPGPTSGAERHSTAEQRWESHPVLARCLRAAILVAPIAASLIFTATAARFVPPERFDMNRWLWILLVFLLANLLLAAMRRVIHSLAPLVTLMKLTLVFPDEAPSRAKATLRKSSSRTMLRQMEEAKAQGETTGAAVHGDYLVQLLTEVNEHDRLTRGHSERVRAYAEMLGEELGLDEHDMNRLRWAALLHDVGKLEVPYDVLNKAGRPTDEEWRVLSAHPSAGATLLEPLRGWLGDWVHAADQHHCRWDGNGYPSELAGTDIALAGRIVAVADAYDVMTSARSYKKPLSAEVARQELTECAGSQFDPAMVRAFLNISLGRLRTVAGPFGWLVNLLASAQVKVPIAATVGSGFTSAAAVVAVTVAGIGPGEAPEALAMIDTTPPLAVSDARAAGDEDQPIVVTLAASGGAGPISFSVDAPRNGDVQLDGDGSDGGSTQAVTYRPERDFNGRDSFGFRACDADGDCQEAVASVEVRAINDPPEAVDDRRAGSADETLEIDVLANDVDVDGDGLTIVDLGAPYVATGVESAADGPLADPVAAAPGEAIALDGGQVLFIPRLDFAGTAGFTYAVADPSGARSTATVLVDIAAVLVTASTPAPEPTLTPVPTPPPPSEPPPTPEPPPAPDPPPPPPNLPPAAVDDAGVTTEDTELLIDVLANDQDPERDTLSIAGVGDAEHGAATIESGGIRYRPDTDYHGSDSFTYVVSDGVNPAVTATVAVTVTPVNDAPVLSGPAAVTIDETAAIGSIVAALTGTDPDGDPLTYDLTAGDPGGHFAVDGNGVTTVAAPLDFETTPSYSLHIELSDGTAVSSHVTTVTITDVNEAPVAVDDSGAGFNTDEDTSFTTAAVTGNDSDVDNPIDPTAITIVTGPTNGSLTDNSDGTFDYDPDPEWSGTDSFSYTVTDGGLLTSNVATVTVVVAAVNDAPDVTDPGSQAGAEQTPFSLQVTATDRELDNLAYGAVGLPAGLSIDANGLITGIPDPGTQGSHSVDVTVTDDGAAPAQTTVTFALDLGYHLLSADDGNVVLNEVLYNSVSGVAPEEFIELNNGSAAAVDLTGWTLADANLKADGTEDLSYTFPATDHWGAASTLAAGDHAVVWLVYDGANLPPLIGPGRGLEYVVNVAGTKLDDAGDDLWLLDTETRLVDYVAFGGGAAVGTPPEVALNAWDATHQAALLTASAESIVLTPNGTARHDSACWEPTGSGDASGRCTGAEPTIDSDSMGSLATSVGTDNNAAVADAGGPYLIVEGDALVLDGSSSVGASTWNWDLDNDGQYDDASGVNPSVPWATLAALGVDDDGVYPVGLEVDGGDDTASVNLTATNLAPTLATTGTGSVSSGGTYTLNLAVTDPGDDTITGWTINWGDGNVQTIVGNPSSVTHTYVGAGFTFDILASATDEDGTYLQNELVVPSYDTQRVYRYEATSGAFLQRFDTGTQPIEAMVGPDGQLYVSGQQTNDVRRYNATTGAFVDVFVGAGAGGMTDADGMAFGPDGNLYIADYTGSDVLRFDGATGNYIDVFASGGLSGPYGLVFGPDLNLYVNEFDADEVTRFNGSTGAFIDKFVAPSSGGLDRPEQMTFGPDGNLYVSSFSSDQVLRYDGTTGAFIDVFIAAGGAGDLDEPTGVAFGPDGHLYVSDYLDDVILRYDGTTGAFIDQYVAPGAGGLTKPVFLTFLPEHQVTVTP